MTIYEAVNRAKKHLERNGVPDAGIDALLLLQFVCGIDRAQYYAHPDRELPEDSGYMEKVLLRGQHVPLQQITREQYFCSLKFRVTQDVLCPRQDTETLVEEALERVRPGDRVLDLCTGSGCILISMMKLCPGIEGTGLDLSSEALKVARENAAFHSVDCRFEKSDLYEKAEGTYDMIVSNPPYIASDEIEGLMEEVRDHEPRMALDGGKDGLEFYRRILREAPEYLREGGWLLAEIGCSQARAVRSIMIDAGFTDTSVVKDLGGNDRVVLGKRGLSV